MDRRHFLISAPAVFAFAKATQAEDFPVFQSDINEVDYRFRKREVKLETTEPTGTIIVDSHLMYLFFILGEGKAIRYGVGVGRQGSDWSGIAEIRRKVEWPRWTPTPEQLTRHPMYGKWKDGMPGGTGNPLGARAMYLFQGNVDTLYRIHGTEVPSSIGHAVSSGCIRMVNVDVVDLYSRVEIGSRVVVLPAGKRGIFG